MLKCWNKGVLDYYHVFLPFFRWWSNASVNVHCCVWSDEVAKMWVYSIFKFHSWGECYQEEYHSFQDAPSSEASRTWGTLNLFRLITIETSHAKKKKTLHAINSCYRSQKQVNMILWTFSLDQKIEYTK